MSFMSALQWLSDNSTQIICILAVVHFLGFIYLLSARRNRLRKMGEQLREILNETGVGTSMMAELSDDDLIDSCCQDLLGILKERNAPQLETLREKLATFDRLKPYKRTHRVETGYNVARTAIEAYPLLGILGTVIALAVGIGQADLSMTPARDVVSVQQQSAETASAQDMQEVPTRNSDAATRANRIIENFGDAIWSTLVGLVFGVSFMLWNASFELGFERLGDHRRSIAEVIMWARKVLTSGQVDENA